MEGKIGIWLGLPLNVMFSGALSWFSVVWMLSSRAIPIPSLTLGTSQKENKTSGKTGKRV